MTTTFKPTGKRYPLNGESEECLIIRVIKCPGCTQTVLTANGLIESHACTTSVPK